MSLVYLNERLKGWGFLCDGIRKEERDWNVLIGIVCRIFILHSNCHGRVSTERVDQLINSIILMFPWSQVDKEAADARGAEGNAMGGGAGARGTERIAKGAADARIAERNESGVEHAHRLGEGSMEIGQETNLHRDGGEHASKPSASVEVSALLHNRSLFLNWVWGQNSMAGSIAK
jgi:hypothetical protein